MGLSRQTKIIALLVIDSAFFFLELIVGYAVGSLALVADSFHMLNDVLSLVVALYTMKLATSPSSSANSYGWQRAEILGALINGVFLVALCMTIALEAIGRIVSPPEITTPKLIVAVGSAGLLSNIIGLVLFHDHGSGGRSHSSSEGAIALPSDPEDESPTNTTTARQRERADSMSSLLYQHPAQTRAQVIETAQEYGYGRRPSVDESTALVGPMSPPSSSHHRGGSMSRAGASQRKKGSQSSSGGVTAGAGTGTRPKAPRSRSDLNAVPAVGDDVVRSPISGGHDDHKISTANGTASGGASGSSGTAVAEQHEHGSNKPKQGVMAGDANAAEAGHAGHKGHGHGGKGGHGQGSMNMRGVFLHVVGDALGNIGVIAAGLVIWFFEGRWTLYFDPGISLLITCIIFSSAMPLVKSASYILMQGVPSHVSLEAVRSSIKAVPGVVSVHELHIWQLSESTVVASVHVLITPGQEYMDVANGIKAVMHDHGIHSVTIQPEFYDEDNPLEEETSCLIQCPPGEQCATSSMCM